MAPVSAKFIGSLDLPAILSPVPVADFLNDYYGLQTLYLPGRAEKFESLISWASLPKIREVSSDTFRIERVDKTYDPLMDFANDLERTLEAPVRIDLDAAPPAHKLQTAPQDLLVLQASGQTEWKVVSEQQNWEGTLSQGDALYIPRGCRHLAASSMGRALRLLIAIENPRGADLAHWLLPLLANQPRFQGPIPRFGDPSTQAGFLDELRRTIGGAFRIPDILEHYLHSQAEIAPLRPLSGVPFTPSLSGDHLIRVATPRRLRIHRADEDTVFFVSHGKRLQFPAEAAQFLHYLEDQSPVALSDFYTTFEGEFDREELTDFLSVLEKDRIIVFRSPVTNDSQ